MVVGIGKMASGNLGLRSGAQYSSRGRMSPCRVGLHLRIEKLIWKNVQVKVFRLDSTSHNVKHKYLNPSPLPSALEVLVQDNHLREGQNQNQIRIKLRTLISVKIKLRI